MRSKTMLLFISILELCFVMSGCGFLRNSHKVYMGFDKADYTIVAEEDTHGGFNGDGSYYLILDCSAAHDKALDIVKEWNPMPLSENLKLIMYGGEKDGISYSFELAEEAHWPIIEHGYYKFNDKQSDDPADDSELFNRYSFNFEIAAYDTDNKLFYYFRFDT